MIEESPEEPITQVEIPKGQMQIAPLEAVCNYCGQVLRFTGTYPSEEEMLIELNKQFDAHNLECKKGG
jgi:hypothetical protein